MTNPHKVIEKINEAILMVNMFEGPYAYAHRVAYVLGNRAERQDAEGIFDGSSQRWENHDLSYIDVTGEEFEAYVPILDENERAGEVHTILDEWETIALIWDNVRATYPGNYIVHIDHKDMNMWEVTINAATLPPHHVTYLVKGDRVERQNA